MQQAVEQFLGGARTPPGRGEAAQPTTPAAAEAAEATAATAASPSRA